MTFASGPLDRLAGLPYGAAVSRERNGVDALVVYALSRVYTFGLAIAIAVASNATVGSILSRWDGGWYLSVVRSGYPTVLPTIAGEKSSIAFFPGYPILIRAMSAPTGLSPILVGVAVATLSGAGASVALFRLGADLMDRSTAYRAVALFAFFPTAFVLSMVYADALFLLLAAVCLVGLVERRWLVAGLAAGVATCVRPTGIVLVGSCLWGAVEAIRRERAWRSLVAPALAPIGLVVYVAYLRVHTGSATAFMKVANLGWGRRFDLGAWNVTHALGYAREGRTVFLVAVIAVMLVGVAVGMWLLLRWRPPAAITVYVVGVVALTVLTSHPVSLPRYVMSAFPLLIPAADRLRGRAYGLIVVGSMVLMALLFAVTSVSTRLPP